MFKYLMGDISLFTLLQMCLYNNDIFAIILMCFNEWSNFFIIIFLLQLQV